MLKERNEHLDSIFGITKKQEEPQHIQSVVTTVPSNANTSVAVVDGENNNELKKSLEDNISKLDIMYIKLEGVLDAHAEVCTEFSKGRDVEALAKLAQTMVDLNRESRETKLKMFEKEKKDTAVNQQIIANQTNNTIEIGSMRELNDLLKLQKESSTKS
jgi:hypothetical protein